MHDFAGVGAFSSLARAERLSRSELLSSRFDTRQREPSLRRQALARLIETEIAPQLLAALRSARTERRYAPASAQIDEFLRILLRGDSDAVFAFVGGLLESGVSREQVLLDFFAPAARKLGRFWESDRCDFFEVTNGAGLLQTVMGDLTADWEAAPEGARARRALLSVAPGETHSFGIAMVHRFFQTAGWRVSSCSPENCLNALNDDFYDLAGFSVSCRRHVERLELAIREVRRKSKNSAIAILVGGDLINQDPSIVSAVDADGTATDASSAVAAARNLLDQNAFV
jgi:MerR family transcriptional regulator, light-induced transcriptional regulator